VLVFTNLYPDASSPHRGRFVADQVEALRGRGVSIELFTFPPGAREYLPASRRLRRHLSESSYDLVHAHYGLAGWCARRAGAHPLIVTFHGTDVRHRIVGPLSRRLARRVELAAGVSRSLFETEAGRPGLPNDGKAARAVLPCGVDRQRFRPLARAEARRALDLDPAGRFLLFPADPARPEKRHDRAKRLADGSGATLLTAGSVDPDRMPLLVNAANAVLVTSDREGFGLAALEALACRVPVLSTPVGIAPLALSSVEGCLVAAFDQAAWLAALMPHLESTDPRVDGERITDALSAAGQAERVLEAYRWTVGE
jgi:glycosyltransferase involved in cell wall biosynthesis